MHPDEPADISLTRSVILRPFLGISSHPNRHAHQGVILGCTEIGLLVGRDDSTAAVLDTTEIHALAAVEYALGDKG